jgi:hypothetical protein
VFPGRGLVLKAPGSGAFFVALTKMMEQDSYRMAEVLRRMSELLRVGRQEAWADLLEKLRRRLDGDPTQVKYEIRRLFGGMGSINDIVLVGSTGVLTAENEELALLRSGLYELAH